MVKFHPIELRGSWDKGFSLDKHVISSTYIGESPFGNAMFHTTRTEIGELMYRLKYRNDFSVVEDLASVSMDFIRNIGIAEKISVILLVPPTRSRQCQPVYMIASVIAEKMGKFYADDALIKEGEIEAKNVDVNADLPRNTIVRFSKKLKRAANFLLIDDIFHSGETLNACVSALREDPLTGEVYVLTMTKRKD